MDTKASIIQAALSVLQTLGSEGLTLRKVAAHAGISLGNLQYHFKDKPSLFVGLAEFYFGECVTLLDRYTHDPKLDTRDRLHRLILFFLDHVDHLSEMCRLFRELWALAARDPAIRDLLDGYYRLLGEKLSVQLAPFSDEPAVITRWVALLLPYFEGYSINGTALPVGKAEVADMLTDLCLSVSE